MQSITPSIGASGGPPPGGPPALPSDAAPPGASGMMTPQTPDGKIAGGKVTVMLAVKVLTQTLGAFEPGSPEFKAVMKAVTSLEKMFGQEAGKTEELMPADIKNLMQSLSGPGQMPAPPVPGGMMPPPGGMPPPPGGAMPPPM